MGDGINCALGVAYVAIIASAQIYELRCDVVLRWAAAVFGGGA